VVRRVLFVCAGNQCRSPMAEAFFKRLIGCQQDVEVSSAGLYGGGGLPPSRKAVAVMAKRGVDISQVRSKKLSRKLAAKSDIIVTMEEEQRDIIKRLYNYSKVFTLREIAGGSGDIADPLGAPISLYEQCANEIEHCLHQGVEKILA
jgi:protein-tyrosine-phosphatase